MVELTQDISEQAKEPGRLRLIREKEDRKITWDEFAELTGVKRSTISSIALRYDEMTLRVAVMVCDALGIDLDDFLGLGPGSKRKHARAVTAGGRVDLQGVKGRAPVRLEIDLPGLGLQAGDVLLVDTMGEPQLGKLVVAEDDDGAGHVYRVRALNPMILERAAGPAAVSSRDRVRATVIRLIRDDP